MLRIPALALAGVMAIGLTTAADARGGHSHGSHGSGGVRSFSASRSSFVGHSVGFHRGRGFHRRHAFFRGHFHGSCYRWREVWTPYGWRLRRVYVCGPWYWRHRHWRHHYFY
jgi:hypothetical protein